jgi:hypothetical protein
MKEVKGDGRIGGEEREAMVCVTRDNTSQCSRKKEN